MEGYTVNGQTVEYQTLITDSVDEAAERLRLGQTVIFPTETVYGLGADATNPAAVLEIYEAKQRPADNPLIVHIHDLAQVEELAHRVPAYAYKLMEHYFPGPLTILLHKQPVIPDITTAGSPLVCLRMPSLPISLEFLKACNLPVAAPSANISGRPSPTRWQDCLEDMDGRVGAILRGPEATHGLESTIVDCTGANPVLMRPGIITLEELAQLIPGITAHIPNKTIALPGMKYRHYAPRARVFMLEGGSQPPTDLLEPPVAYIGLEPPVFETDFQLILDSPIQYAHELFAFMRECDRKGMLQVYAQRLPEKGIGRALMNRLNKAAEAHL
ncbi:MAG: threonylcarbamoyl-AMP synthase [Chloroflexi bacterium]|uniref:Threonylcarbamoyl-AMP synthase n=1 Tax=Candidatus Chlorohelix allophototropha TaxID=3003348 RepID=A0A8T7M0T8_9CHLR|nr:threonylcarbamoyl-AMP synthase [Chloroflexota bacterium]WJW67392.1 threonylcarbamoyl-AMP synthase [Chloroflexota bacterium L227-S17]